jgi:DNA polymerase-1
MNATYAPDYNILTHKLHLPNVRKLFRPDPGWLICDTDLAQADAQVVAADANDESLLEIFRDPTRDLHNENAQAIFGGRYYPKGEEHPQRQLAKGGVHAVNYYVQARTLAATLGITVHEAEEFIRKWFSAHPAIKDWHHRIQSEMQTRRFITNAFGNRKVFLGRIDNMTALQEALAWIPQSTVGLVINRGWVNLYKKYPQNELQVILQVHDSLVFQIPCVNVKTKLAQIKESLLIPIPYPTPLVIGVGISVSKTSWGDVIKLEKFVG